MGGDLGVCLVIDQDVLRAVFLLWEGGWKEHAIGR